MPYCTLDDLKARIPEFELVRLTDDENSGAVDTTVTDAAIAEAGVEIDAWIGKRVKLPIAAPIPPILVGLAANLAIHILHGRGSAEIPDAWKDKRKAAIDLLKAYAKGDVTLGVEPEPDAPEDYSGGVKVCAPAKIFGSDTLDKF